MVRMINASVAWSIGYLFFWMMKWILVDILTGSHTILDAINTVKVRTSKASGSMLEGFIKVVKMNISVYENWAFLLLFAVIMIWLLIRWCKTRVKYSKSDTWKSVFMFLGIAMYPFGWFMLVQNHSEEHWMFTFKILSISVFAGICAVGKIGDNHLGEG